MSVPETAGPRHRVLIVGGGFAGLKAARRLSRRKDVDLTLVDRVNHHLFQPLLYQVATGILSPGQIAPPLRSLFRDRDNVRILLGEVTGLDLERRVVAVEGLERQELGYDTLIVAAGAAHSYFGNDEWADAAPGMKTLDDAQRVRARLLSAFEAAEEARSADERRAWLTFVIVGGGPTGVELAGQVAFLARRMLRGEYRSFTVDETRIVLADGAPALLGAFPEGLRGKARRELERMGVEVRLGAVATAIDDEGITLSPPDGEATRIATRTVVWAAGVKASPLAARLAEAAGSTVDRAGRLSVNPDLTVGDRDDVYAAGDMVALEGVPGVAQGALQQGHYVADAIARRLDGKGAPKGPFHYRDKGSMAVVGRSQAVAAIGPLRLAGRIGWAIWAVIHIAFLVGWQNRVETVRRWFWDLTTKHRHERIVDVGDLPRGGRPAPR